MHNYQEEILNLIFKIKKIPGNYLVQYIIQKIKKKNSKHKHKQENQIDENFIHE